MPANRVVLPQLGSQLIGIGRGSLANELPADVRQRRSRRLAPSSQQGNSRFVVLAPAMCEHDLRPETAPDDIGQMSGIRSGDGHLHRVRLRRCLDGEKMTDG